MVFRRILRAPSSSLLFLGRRMNNFFHFIAVRRAVFYLRNYLFIKIVVRDDISLFRLVGSAIALYNFNAQERKPREKKRKKPRQSFGFANVLLGDATTNFASLFIIFEYICHKHGQGVVCQPRCPQTISQRRIIHDRMALARSRS